MAPTSLKAGLLLLSQLHLTWAMILAPRQQVSCTLATAASFGDTCASFAAKWTLTEHLFESLNPGLNCSNLVAGQNYCVVGTTSSASITTSSSLITSTRVPTMSSLASDQPQQTGTAANCNKFYLVQPEDSCTAIEIQFGLSRNEFMAWNPTVNKNCTNIIAGYYYCVSVPGANKFSITTSSKTTPTSGITAPTNGTTTPTPIQTGMVTSCNKFYFVQSGDSCAAIATKYDVSLATFYSWNPAVGSSCATLNVGYYVCVDAIGHMPPNTTTTMITKTTKTTKTMTATSSAGNGSTTPTPFEPGMVADCKKFFLVGLGNTCASIATSQGTTVDNIKKWNSGVGSNCTALWLGNYICVGV